MANELLLSSRNGSGAWRSTWMRARSGGHLGEFNEIEEGQQGGQAYRARCVRTGRATASSDAWSAVASRWTARGPIEDNRERSSRPRRRRWLERPNR